MPRPLRGICIASFLLLLAAPAAAGLLTVTVVSGVAAHDGATPIEDPLWRETLSGTTLAQLGTPMLVDPESGALLGLTVRITNTSDAAVTFPNLFAGVSVLASVSGIPGYASKTLVAAGGSANADGNGAEGAVQREVLDMTASLDATSSPASGGHGGGGAAAVGVADCWISVTGASGAELAALLADLTLEPGAYVDIPDFIRIAAFGRSVDEARIAFGFDIATFSSNGRSVTTGAWTGAFTGPGVGEPPPPVAVPEPPAWPAVLLGMLAGGGLRRPRRDRVEDGAREHR